MEDTTIENTLSTATIRLQSQDETIAVFGEGDRNLKRLKEKLSARILARGDSIRIEGEKTDVQKAENLIRDLLAIYRQGGDVGMEEIERGLELLENGNPTDSVFVEAPPLETSSYPGGCVPRRRGRSCTWRRSTLLTSRSG
ncbi:MAG: hypothetical protein HC933_07285 [Pleurocapsa sp. SU_196_0]|nr:hypothetical protein [Pleurocapsa sp. SU_196_0]